MAIYIDKEFKCYTSDGADRTAVALSESAAEFFDGKCAELVEGHRYIPDGKTWVNAKGVEITGEAVFPWVDSRELAQKQAEYEHELLLATQAELADADAALAEMGVTVDGL